jgi:hypothetical protein
MPKIILTAEEEIQYLRELDQMQEMMPDLEIQVLNDPAPYKGGYAMTDSKIGDEFRSFLKASNLKLSLADVERK